MTITYQPKDEPEWIIGGSKPLASELWDILSADYAYLLASHHEDLGHEEAAKALRAYADKVNELQGRAQ